MKDLLVMKKMIINIKIIESTENIYHVKRQDLHFAHTPYNKNKLKMAAREWNDDKTF